MNKLTLYNDGFKIKLKNRRVICIKKSDDSYYIRCIALHDKKFTKKELKWFDNFYQRNGITVTTKVISLSTEAIMCIAEGIYKFEHSFQQLNQQP